ncbi:MAG: NAD-dependent malic enzyme [Gammaproteobacteria bacterium]|nr:NAD-dependent malic enzyme [Gammaproteobacteria bacterium]
MKHFHLYRDTDGQETVNVPLRGSAVLAHSLYNKGTAFTLEERRELGITGLLPQQVADVTQQEARAYEHITRKQDPLEQYIGLAALQDRNETLFYRVLLKHIDEFLPIVYTPTVGEACKQFSHIFRRGRGIWITPEDKGRVAEVLDNAPYSDVQLIVATDAERILGLGDLGAGGMGIPIGKLSLYTVGAGIHPARTLPVCLDVGTDNQSLLDDPLYVGWRHPRVRGPEYDELVEEFVAAVKQKFPNALLQWEDFKKNTAFRLLDRYRDRILSFNDDIQGTAAVALAGIMAAGRITSTSMSHQRVVILGAGAAGVGIARQVRDAMSRDGLADDDLYRSLAVLDSRGLLVAGDEGQDPHKKEFAWDPELVKEAGLDPEGGNSLLDVVKALKPTVLIGTSGQPGSFTEEVVREMASHCARPVIFPFSNPTANSEAVPEDLFEWTDGRALVATGSPFGPVRHEGETLEVAQGNNVYIFPGVGLGALVAQARSVTDGLFTRAAEALAAAVPEEYLDRGLLFPPLDQLRAVSAAIALEVAEEAVASGLADSADRKLLERRIRERMWTAQYPRLKAVPPETESP